MRGKKQWSRGVSIIGCGMTKMGNAALDPALKGMAERDMMAWAALEACRDAGIEPKDIDASAIGQTNVLMMHSLVMGQTLNHILGAEGKPAFAVVQGCATAVALCDIIGAKIASGQIDVGLVLAIATPSSRAKRGEDYFRHPGDRMPSDEWLMNAGNSFDQAYWEHLGGIGGSTSPLGFQMLRYARQYGLSYAQLDDTMNQITVNMRKMAVQHPRSMCAGAADYQQLAKEAGYPDSLSYLRDKKINPFLSWPVRVQNMPQLTDGAAAMVLCASELAGEFGQKTPVELSGIGQGAGIAIPPSGDMRYVTYAEDGAKQQCFSMAGVQDCREFAYMSLHDPGVINHLTDAELVGYMQPGESWRRILDGDTLPGGTRPMQTHGGETQFGDSNDAAAVVDIIEAVQQMRGQCGARQLPVPPRSAIVVGRGVHSIGMMVLRNRERRP